MVAPATSLVGCAVNASWVADDDVMSNATLVAWVRPEEVARSVHLAAFDLLRYEERRRADERTFLFPGGFAYEMTWLGVSTDGATARIRSLLVYFLDEHRRIVRLHEYADAREVVAVLREGVTP